MNEGIAKHAFIQSFYPEECCEVKYEDDNFKGFADIVEEDHIHDIKTVDTKQFNQICSNKYSIYQNKEYCILQTGFYALKMKNDRFYIDFVDREEMARSGSIHIKSFEFDMPFHTQMIEKEVDKLIESWYNVTTKGELPEVLPRMYFGHECSSCEYKNECVKRGE